MLALMVDTFAHPELCVTSVTMNQIPPHTRLALNGFQASCYSHHKSQSALSETNLLLRVSGCNPYLESLPSYIDEAPPWTPTNRGHGITSRPLKNDLEIPPRDLKDLCTDYRPNMFIQSRKTYHAYMYLHYINLYSQSFSRSSSINTNSCFILHS